MTAITGVNIFGADHPPFAVDAYAATPSDTVAQPFIGLMVTVKGDVSITTFAGNVVVLASVPPGAVLWVSGQKIMATGTTATNIIGLV